MSRDPPRNRYQVLREVKQSIRRDLENLLNTRRQPRPLPPGLEELEASLVSYGVPDVSGSGFGLGRLARKVGAPAPSSPGGGISG